MPASPSSRGLWLTRERMVLAGLLAFTVVVRGGVLFALREKLVDDPDAYRRIAENLLADGTFSMDEPDEEPELSSSVRTPNPQKAPWKTPTAYRPPLYPVVLSNLPAGDQARVSLGKVAGLHLLLGLGTVWLTWLTARRLQIGNCQSQIANGGASGGRKSPENGPPREAKSWWAEPTLRMPLVAGVIVACDPILLNQSALVMTETLAAFLAILSLWCVARFDVQRSWFNAGLAGGAMGLAVLCRPTFLPWLGLVGIGMLLVRGRIDNFKLQNANCKVGWFDVGWRIANCAALLVVAGMAVSPWVIRNQRVFGKPIVTTTHGGYTLLLGNNTDFYQYLRSSDGAGVPWVPAMNGQNDFDLAFDSEFTPEFDTEPHRDESYYEDAWDRIAGDPAGFALASFYRVRQLWSPLPYKLTERESVGRKVLRYAVAAWYCGVYGLVVVGIWRLRWQVIQPPWVWGVLLCLIFTGVHTFYWSNLRMRAPLMPFVALVAGASLWPGRQ